MTLPAHPDGISPSQELGDWGALLDAGAIALPAGCGPCVGLGAGLLEDGEVGISATNRNFKGRMGSPNAEAYLASPGVVAASAMAGKMALPAVFADTELKASVEVMPKAAAGGAQEDVAEGFPTQISGDLVFCNQDNINTDGIYPGKYTYDDDVPKEKMGQVCLLWACVLCVCFVFYVCVMCVFVCVLCVCECFVCVCVCVCVYAHIQYRFE